MCVGLGLMIGPVFSTIFYQFLEYSETLFAFTAIIGLVGIPIAVCLPPRLNDKGSDKDDMNYYKVPWSEFARDSRTVMIALVSMISGATFLIFEPILTPRLVYLKMDESIVGLVFTAISLMYVAGALVFTIFFAGKIDNRYMITVIFILIAVGLVLAGSVITKDSLWQTILGLSLMCFFVAGLFVPTIPEGMNCMAYRIFTKQEEQKGKEFAKQDDKNNDKESLVSDDQAPKEERIIYKNKQDLI